MEHLFTFDLFVTVLIYLIYGLYILFNICMVYKLTGSFIRHNSIISRTLIVLYFIGIPFLFNLLPYDNIISELDTVAIIISQIGLNIVLFLIIRPTVERNKQKDIFVKTIFNNKNILIACYVRKQKVNEDIMIDDDSLEMNNSMIKTQTELSYIIKTLIEFEDYYTKGIKDEI